MKKGFCKFIGIIGIAVVCVSCNLNLTLVRGNGNLVTSEKSVSAFEKIACRGGVEVRFHASEKYRAVVTVDSNLDEYVEISTRDNVLTIGTQRGYNYKFTKFTVDVYCPVLTGVSISGSGNFVSVDKITASTFAADISGSGRVDGTIECDNFNGKISGSGRITTTGTCGNATVSISGSGNYNGNEFEAKNATVTISGSGNVNLYVTDQLNANISGSGNITYRGEPKVDSKVSGSGRIRKM